MANIIDPKTNAKLIEAANTLFVQKLPVEFNEFISLFFNCVFKYSIYISYFYNCITLVTLEHEKIAVTNDK